MTHIRGVPVTLLILLVILSTGAAFLPREYLPIALLALPMLGVIAGTMLPRRMRGKTWGLAVSASTLFTAISMAAQYNWHVGGMQYIVQCPRIPGLNIQFSLGVDEISLMLVLLTASLHPLAVTASLRSIHVRSRQHYAWMNFLLVTMAGTFMATDLLGFYVFFEASLVPLFFIVGMWGGKERKRAAGKLFLYTFFGSIFMLVGILYIGDRAGTFYIPAVVEWAQHTASNTERFWILLSLLAAFGVKTPLFPLHTWLPLAHTEAPTAGSVDLAALVLKLGTYGLLRIALPIGLITANGQILFPLVLLAIAVSCLIGIIYTALVAWVQTDIKRVIAYSSVSHLGGCVLGMLALNATGMAGSVLYMINHGIISGALFLIIGMIYHRYHTRDIRELSGLARAMPRLSFFLVLFTMASVGLPGLNGFVSEFLCLLGAFTSSNLGAVYGVIGAIGIILGAVYMLRLTSALLFGPLYYPVLTAEKETHETVHPKYVMGGDITGREVLVLTPLAIAVIFLGFYPAPLLHALERPLAEIRHADVQQAPVVQAPQAPASIALAQPTR
ncbi:MAG TPA: NADH-quinone oxidoreductase subunit M [Phycisphaerae bacterium]|nr:NADH-quinone oxidoreductase subunit M [Phycisphaerae bacterium]